MNKEYSEKVTIATIKGINCNCKLAKKGFLLYSTVVKASTSSTIVEAINTGKPKSSETSSSAGIKMVVEEQKLVEIESVNMVSLQNIGRTVKSALLQAQADSRVIIGLTECINILSKIPEGSLFCLLAKPQAGDSATHMHEVLLEAFCYENDIYVIKVDSAEKLSRILGTTSIVSCVLIQKSFSKDQIEENLNKMENAMVDHCEAFWDATIQPVIQLPAV